MEDKHNQNKSNNKSENSSETSIPVDIPYAGSSVTVNSSHSPNIDASVMFPGAVPASPPSFVSLEQLLKAAEDVSKSGFDMALAHEIAVNKDFQLQKKVPSTGVEQEVTEICHKAFWDLLSERLSADPPDYSQAMVLLKEIKEELLWLLLPHCSRLRNEINEVLDLQLIEQQARRGALSVLSYASFVISTMSSLCAPVRDARIRELRQLTDVVPLYKGILETLELMKLDMVNFTISQFRPNIQQHSVEYEQKKFKEILDSLKGLTPPVDGLKFTRLWLQNAHDAVCAESGGEEPSNALVLRRAYLDVLKWKQEELFPETLHLDHQRFIKLKEELTVMVLTATVILVTYSSVGHAIQGIADFKDTLKRHLLVLLADAHQCSAEDLPSRLESVSLQVAEEVRGCLEKHGFAPLVPEREAALKDVVKATADEAHHVRQLITRRILEFLDLVLQSPPDLAIPPGLSSLQKELAGFSGQFLALVRHNQSVFCDYYDDILTRWKATK